MGMIAKVVLWRRVLRKSRVGMLKNAVEEGAEGKQSRNGSNICAVEEGAEGKQSRNGSKICAVTHSL